MGCQCSGPKDVEEIDREVLANFLQNKENLLAIWKQFNKNEDDVLDRGEFDRLLFSALQIFCKERDPDMPPPTREVLEPFIEKLRTELAPRIDTDGDGVISFEEFKSFGEYLKREYNKLQTQHNASVAGGVPSFSAGNITEIAGGVNTNSRNVNTKSNLNNNTNSNTNTNTNTNVNMNNDTRASINADTDSNINRKISDDNNNTNVNANNEICTGFNSSIYGVEANPAIIAGSIVGIIGGLPTGTETIAMNSKNVTNDPDIASVNVDIPISNNDDNVAK